MYAVNKIPIARQDAIAGKPGSYSKSETLGGRYRRNGYVLSHKSPLVARSLRRQAWLLKSETLSGRYRSNGYVLSHKSPLPVRTPSPASRAPTVKAKP
jgi:hypothetical protein